MLTLIFRLQLIIKEPYYITLRLESIKMYSNYFWKRVSIFLPKIILGRERPATRFHLRLMPLSRIRKNVSISVRRTDLFFADFLPRPFFLIFFLISAALGERSIQLRRLLYGVPQTPKSYKKRAQNIRRKEVLLYT